VIRDEAALQPPQDDDTRWAAVGECSLGSILVAATDKGVCAILLGEAPDALLRFSSRRKPD
jgi:hypothetical protein